jgi:hypothetical protein
MKQQQQQQTPDSVLEGNIKKIISNIHNEPRKAQ